MVLLPVKGLNSTVCSGLSKILKPESCGKFGFYRPDLDGNKLAEGMCLARKEKDRELFI